MWFNATIANDGLHDEAFDVTLSANFTKLETQSITLSAGKTLMLKLRWNTTGFDCGNYTLTVAATLLQGEAHTGDNTMASLATATMAGDVTGDLCVDVLDAIVLSRIFGLREGQQGRIGECDLNGDASVNILDAIALATNLGTQVQWISMIS